MRFPKTCRTIRLVDEEPYHSFGKDSIGQTRELELAKELTAA